MMPIIYVFIYNKYLLIYRICQVILPWKEMWWSFRMCEQPWWTILHQC